jgi:hypothetical protein
MTRSRTQVLIYDQTQVRGVQLFDSTAKSRRASRPALERNTLTSCWGTAAAPRCMLIRAVVGPDIAMDVSETQKPGELFRSFTSQTGIYTRE